MTFLPPRIPLLLMLYYAALNARMFVYFSNGIRLLKCNVRECEKEKKEAEEQRNGIRWQYTYTHLEKVIISSLARV